MMREVNLVSYFPPFMQAYREPVAALEAENPEFQIIWEAADRVLKNNFISTADEYGIARFEKILKILPSTEDTLESRRARVQSRWFDMIPYTLKMLIKKLTVLCGDTDFTITKAYQNYRIEIITGLGLFGQVEELERIVKDIVPCNMITILENQIICRPAGMVSVSGNVCCVEQNIITNDFNERLRVEGTSLAGAGTVISETFEMKEEKH